MKKSTLLLLLAGCFLLTAGLILELFLHMLRPKTASEVQKFTFDGASTIETELMASSLTITQSEDDQIHLQYTEQKEKSKIEVFYTGDTLLIKEKARFPYLSFSHRAPSVQLALPSSFIGALYLSQGAGSISLQAVPCQNLTLSLGAGSASLQDLQLQNLTIEAATGGIHCKNLHVEKKLQTSLTTGTVKGENIQAEQLLLTTTTGSIHLTQAQAEKVELQTSTGSLHFADLKGEDLRLSTTTGSINGQLFGKQTDYRIHARSVTGKNKLPTDTEGGTKTLFVETTTGTIDIRFSQE